MRGACIDIGSNTTRLLVAEVDGRAVRKVEQRRAFTHLRRALAGDGAIPAAKVREIVAGVAAQVELARSLGAERVVAVGTAAIRRAANAAALVHGLRGECALELWVLSEAEEARLAFLGASAAFEHAHGSAAGEQELGVVDVGGGSSELVVGVAPDTIAWWSSQPIGSGALADACFGHDPPGPSEVAAARSLVVQALSGLRPPRPAAAVAVGGSAASLLPLAGRCLDGEGLARALELLLGAPAADVAGRFALDVERVRLLPAGLLILDAAHGLFGVPLEIVGGGLREGVLMEMAGGG